MTVVELCLSPGFGGLEMYPHKVMLGLTERGYACHAVVAPGTLLAGRLVRDGLPHSNLTVRSRVLPLLAARRLALMLEELEADIVHAHWTPDLNIAALAKRFCKRRTRLVFSRQMALTRSKRDPFHRLLYGSVDNCIVISRQLEEQAHRFLPMAAEDIELIYYGVPEPPLPAPGECETFFRESGVEGPGLKVGYFGRIEPIKGPHVLIEAMGLLKDRGCATTTALAGRIMDEAYFEDLMLRVKTRGLEDRVRYLGFLDEPSRVMGCFDVIVLTTFGETFGLVIAEAMRAGVAVVGTAAGGVPEMICDGETGLLFEPGDAGELAGAIERLAQEPELRRRLATAGKELADREFSDEGHFDRLIKHFHGVLSGR